MATKKKAEVVEEVKVESTATTWAVKEIGKIDGVPVFKDSDVLKTKHYTTPVPMYLLPDEIRKYLQAMWFGTNVYLKGKEWLEAHDADMEMIAKLKKFISEHY